MAESDLFQPEDERLTYCLSMDLEGSTTFGMSQSTLQWDRFNADLVKQISPHIRQLSLDKAVIKFTGDGWIVMVDQTSIRGLCCLALIEYIFFRKEMSERLSRPVESIPRMRVAICSGRDISVTLPDNRRDWVGDSSRRSARVLNAYETLGFNEGVLVDYSVYSYVFRDFDIPRIPEQIVEEALGSGEEYFHLYQLRGLSENPDARPEYVYTLSVLGQLPKANAIISQVREELVSVEATTVADMRNLRKAWNRLISSVKDYSKARQLYKSMLQNELSPDIYTFNMLTFLAPTYDEAEKWIDVMDYHNVALDRHTYTNLIMKSEDYSTALSLLEDMDREEIEPDTILYNAMIARSPNVQEARRWLNTIKREGLGADTWTYNTLISKAEDFDQAVKIAEEMQSSKVPADVVTYRTLMALAPEYEAALVWFNRLLEEEFEVTTETANTLLDKAETWDQALETINIYDSEDIPPDNHTLNILLKNVRDLQSALGVLKVMEDREVKPDVYTLNTVMGRLSEEGEIEEWYDEMLARGVVADGISYAIRASTTQDEELATRWMERATKTKKGVGALFGEVKRRIALADQWGDVLRLTRLLVRSGKIDNLNPFMWAIGKCGLISQGKEITELVRQSGMRPHHKLYVRLFKDAELDMKGEDLLKWYLNEQIHSDIPVEVLISRLSKEGRDREALTIAWHYPHCGSARALIRRLGQGAIDQFVEINTQQVGHPNQNYSLGVAYLELGPLTEASKYLRKALEVATGRRRDAIIKWLRSIED